MNYFNKKNLALILLAVFAVLGQFAENFDLFSPSELNRSPAQYSSPTSPFISQYLNPRPGCTMDFQTCGQANDCCSTLCLNNSCVPRYFSDVKGSPGQICSSNDQCYSSVCDIDAQKCVGSSVGLCAYVAQYCSADTQCCSGTCNSSVHQCEGNAANECGPVQAPCSTADQCCSGVCDQNRHSCVGSAANPGGYGAFCVVSDQCSSNLCDMNRHICQ